MRVGGVVLIVIVALVVLHVVGNVASMGAPPGYLPAPRGHVGTVVRMAVRVVADIGGSANDAFASGVAHQVNPGHANLGSITLGDAASAADQGLADTSSRWNSEAGTGYTPHSVLAGLPGMSGDGMSAADAQRVLPGGAQLQSPDGIGESSYQQSTLLHNMYGTE